MVRYCGLEQWEARHSIVNLVLVMSTFLKYEARSSVETKSRRWCEKGGEEESHLLSKWEKKNLSQKGDYLSGDHEMPRVLRALCG